MQIRPDDVEVNHLLAQFVTFATTFRRFNVTDWSELKNRHDFDSVYARDRTDRKPLEDTVDALLVR